MTYLDCRIKELALKLEIKYGVELSEDNVKMLSEGLSLGYSPNNTWENLAIQFEKRLVTHLSKLEQ